MTTLHFARPTDRLPQLAAGFLAEPAAVPVWEKQGRTFEDMDGHRVVLQQGAWAA